jgi:hypothetical protein
MPVRVDYMDLEYNFANKYVYNSYMVGRSIVDLIVCGPPAGKKQVDSDGWRLLVAMYDDSHSYALHFTFVASPLHVSNKIYHRMTQDVLNLPQVKQHKFTVKRIFQFMLFRIFAIISLKFFSLFAKKA